MSDNINPQHYKRGNTEVIGITRHLNFNRGNAVKYAARAGEKDPAKTVEDLRKAMWYIVDELYRLGYTPIPDDIKPHYDQ